MQVISEWFLRPGIDVLDADRGRVESLRLKA